jgi:hypothetical protein
METQSNTIIFKSILIFIGIGIWVIVLQNAGIIPKLVGTENGTQTVYVKGGYINADVEGTVGMKGTVSVSIDEVLGKDGIKYYYDNRGNNNNNYSNIGY